MFKKVLFFLLIFLHTVAAIANPDRFALIIGNNKGLESNPVLNYAQNDAKKIYKLLTEIGGFESKNTKLLLDKDSNTIWKALLALEKKAVTQKKKTGQNTLLLIYYSGHAGMNALYLNGTTLSFKKLHKFLTSSASDVRLAFIDSCHSGEIISAKGFSRGPQFKINVNNSINSKGYAIITSSTANELSQESKAIRGAFFTHQLASALRGAGDISRDGNVTLQEVYKYVYSRTLSQTVESSGVTQHPMYHFELKGQGDIILTKTDKSSAEIKINYIDKGRIFLMDAIGDNILAEGWQDDNLPTLFSVPEGSYILYHVTNSGEVSYAEIKAVKGLTVIDQDSFYSINLTAPVAKGGLFKTSPVKWSNRAGAGFIIRNGPLEGMKSAKGAVIYYRGLYKNGLELIIKNSLLFSPDAGISTGYKEFGFYGGIGRVWNIYHLILRLEILIGFEEILQSQTDKKRYTSGFAYSAGAGFEIPLNNAFIALDGGTGMRFFKVVDKGIVNRFDFQSFLSLGWRFDIL